MFIATLLVIVPSRNVRQNPMSQLKCPSIVEQINKLRYIYTVEYISATKINKPQPHALLG